MVNIKSHKNGYAYVYLSNESNEPVYFDNFKVGDNRGRIIEEDHYYSFGLKIAAISSKKLGDGNEGLLENKNLYNDKEFFDDADLDWYDYGFRNYDPQIGRFAQLDPLTDDYPELTPYQYASNEPIANVDMDGLELKESTQAFSWASQSTSSFSQFIVPAWAKTVVPKIASKTISKTFQTTLKIAGKALQAGLRNIPDNTYVKSTIGNPNAPSNKPSTPSLWDKFTSLLDKMSHGDGSYQNNGIVFSGNDNGGGTREFKDHAGEIIDNIDLGPGFFGLLKAAGLDPNVFKELLKSPGGLKYIVHSLEAGKTVLEAGETIHDATKLLKPKDVTIRKRVGAKWIWSNEDGGVYEGAGIDTIHKRGSKPGDPDTTIYKETFATPNPSRKKKP